MCGARLACGARRRSGDSFSVRPHAQSGHQTWGRAAARTRWSRAATAAWTHARGPQPRGTQRWPQDCWPTGFDEDFRHGCRHSCCITCVSGGVVRPAGGRDDVAL